MRRALQRQPQNQMFYPYNIAAIKPVPVREKAIFTGVLKPWRHLSTMTWHMNNWIYWAYNRTAVAKIVWCGRIWLLFWREFMFPAYIYNNGLGRYFRDWERFYFQRASISYIFCREPHVSFQRERNIYSACGNCTAVTYSCSISFYVARTGYSVTDSGEKRWQYEYTVISDTLGIQYWRVHA